MNGEDGGDVGGDVGGDGFGTGPDGINDISWTAAFPLITRWLLLHYGDVRVVERNYPALKR